MCEGDQQPEPAQQRRPWQFSLRTLFGITTLCALFCSLIAAGAGSVLLAVLAVGLVTTWPLAVLLLLDRPGPKLDGALSVAGCVGCHLAFFILVVTDGFHRSGEEYVAITAAIFVVVCYVAWLGFAVTAFRTRRSPNVGLAGLSLLGLLSPITWGLSVDLYEMICRGLTQMFAP